MARQVTIELPESVYEALGSAEQVPEKVQEATVLRLWQEGEVSTRVAAEALGLSYAGFLDLLAKKKIPVESGPLNIDSREDIADPVKP